MKVKSLQTLLTGSSTLLLLCLLSAPLYGATFYVGTSGTKTSGASTVGDWSNSNCYGTISAAIQRMSGGDEVVVNDGVYTGVENVIGRRNVFAVPNGTAAKYTVIKARNPFKVTIDSGVSSSWDYYGRMVYLPADRQYIHVDGFRGINRDGSNNNFIGIEGNHIKITRCQIRTEGPANNENTVLYIHGDTASDILIEDVAMCGGYRYGFGVIGYDSGPHNIIFRRCVGRADWVQSSEPNAMFSVYGHNSDASIGPHHIYFQNCIAIDQNASVPDLDWKPYGPWYIFKGNHDITMNGCITLRNDQTGSTSGSWVDHKYNGYNITVTNSIFWGYTGIGVTFRGNNVNIEGCTFGGSTGYSLRNYSDSGSFKNNLVIASGSGYIGGANYCSHSYNSLSSSGIGSNQVPYMQDLFYLPRVESNSNRFTAGENGDRVGAHIINRVGVSGTLYGESGWNTETNMTLWPWPYESEIREWFRATNIPPAGASPSTNSTRRGFCTDGETLTRYIWECLGNPMPQEYSSSQDDFTPPSSPGGVSVQVND